MTALEPLAEDAELLKAQIDEILDDLIAMGDVFEMRREDAGGTAVVLRPAPPAFVRRPDATFIILGVFGEDNRPPLNYPIVHHLSGLRTIEPADAQVCRAALLDLGLIELSERAWFHAPEAAPAAEHVRLWTARLPGETRPEKIDNLEILDKATSVSFYKGRWKALSDRHAGVFIARRPQRYGAKLWSLVEVKNGVIQRFTDIHSRDARVRDCDEAWRLQAAFDAMGGSPQKVNVTCSDAAATLSFLSPLPAWAVRRLSLIGERVTPQRALLAFNLPAANAENELRWLSETLWLVRNQGGVV